MKVRVVKIKEKDMKSLWRLSPIVSKPSDSSCFSVLKKRYLWLNGMIIGYRFAISALTAKDKACPAYNDGEVTKYEKCCRCIQKWLNEES